MSGQYADTVLLEQRLDGTVRLRAKGRYVAFTPIAEPARRDPPHVAALAPRALRPRRLYRPPRTHPWKDPSYVAMQRRKAQHANGRCAHVE